MKRPPIPILFLFSVCCAPLLQAQDPSEKVREIERKVLMKQHRDAVHALAGSARENINPEKIGQQLHWLTLVNNRIEGGGRMNAASREEMVRSAHTLNELAWRMIAPREASARTPDIALKLATIAIELGGTDRELNASLLETRARALFMMDRRDEAVMEQEKAVAAATQPKETARFQNTLAAYRRNELPPVERPTAVAAKPAADPAKQENGTAYITGKLKRIILPDVDFEDASMDEVAEFLMKQVHTLDTEEADLSRRGLKFMVVRAPGASPGGSPAGTPDGQQMRVRGLHLRHVPVEVALRYICQMTGGRYRVDEHEVSFLPPDMGPEILTRTFRVPPDFISKLAPGVAADPASGDPAARPSVMEAFKAVGVVFPEGSSASLDESGLLLVRNTSAQLDSIERLIGLIPQDTLEGEQPVVTPPATATDEPSSGVQYIVEKLRTIIVPSVAFDDVSLEEAVDFLRKQSIELDVLEPDPGRKGLNLLIRMPGTTPASGAASGKDLPAGVADPGSLRIRNLHLRNVPLAVAIKYLCDAARCRFKVDDYAVTLVHVDLPEHPLTRKFRVPPDFAARLDSGMGKPPAPDSASRRPLVDVLRDAGVVFGEGSSALLTADGNLMVTNMPAELDKIEQLIVAMTP